MKAVLQAIKGKSKRKKREQRIIMRRKKWKNN